MPSLFISHGSPMLAVQAHATTRAWQALAATLPRPRAVVVASAHFMTAAPALGSALAPETVPDFGGFPPELYRLQYPAPSDPAVVTRVSQLLEAAGLPAAQDPQRGLDHGIWVPLRWLWPQADVPVIPVASTRAGPEPHLALGRALKPFADEGCLVIGTGSITHNLGDLDFGNEYAPVQPWAQAFDDWIADRLVDRDPDALARYRREAPHAVHAHPTDEHLMPLFVALAAGGAAQPTFRGFSHGTISLSAYEFA